jgi:putative serine protease PepD
MTQTTNNENDNSYTWARRPGGPEPVSAPDETARLERSARSQASDGSRPSGEPEPAGRFARPDGSEPAPATAPPRYLAAPAPQYAAAGPRPAAYPQAPAYSDDAHPTGPYPTGHYSTGQYPTGQHTTDQYPTGQYATDQYPAGPAPTTGWGPGGAFGHPSEPETATGGGLPPEPPHTPGRRPARRPGWGGVVGVGVGAAILSSLLTAGIVLQTQDDPVSTVAGTTSQSTVKAPVSSSTASQPDWGAVAKAVEPSVVSVQVTSQSASGEGSGVILDKTGRIVTNNHVVSGAGSDAKIQVVLNDGRTYPATVLGTDSSTDLAVIKLDNPPNDLTPAVLGDSSSVGVGDPVMAVGNPLGLAGTVTTGIVSATDRPTTTQAESQDPTQTQGENVVTNAIQTDAAVNPGNSGGALVDAQGRVIGIPSSIASLSSGSAFGQSGQSGSIGLGFAIPVDEVKDVSSQLIKNGSVSHAWLGVTPDDGTVTADGATRDAAVIKQIVAGAPAAKAGLKVGDAVIKVDGETVNSALSLVGQLRERQTGASVTLTVVRDGKASDIQVVLGTRPASAN